VQSVVILERRILGSSCYTHADFEGVARWIDSGATDLAPVIESRVDLDGLVGAFREYAEGRRQAMKTLYQPA
jgi:threonine dehydrogenase-like Zn-dependent dehydrogenase